MGAICSTGIHPVMINGYFRAMGYRRTGDRELREEKNTSRNEDEMADIVMAYGASHAPRMTADDNLPQIVIGLGEGHVGPREQWLQVDGALT